MDTETDTDHAAKIAEYIKKPPLRVLKNKILVYQEPYKERLASGLFLPQGHRTGFEDRAVVISIGVGAKSVDGSLMSDILKPGDKIIFKRQPSAAIHPDDRESSAEEWRNLLRLDTENILAVIEP